MGLAFIGSVWVLLLAELVRRACGQCRRTAWDLKVKRANRVQKYLVGEPPLDDVQRERIERKWRAGAPQGDFAARCLPRCLEDGLPLLEPGAVTIKVPVKQGKTKEDRAMEAAFIMGKASAIKDMQRHRVDAEHAALLNAAKSGQQMVDPRGTIMDSELFRKGVGVEAASETTLGAAWKFRQRQTMKSGRMAIREAEEAEEQAKEMERMRQEAREQQEAENRARMEKLQEMQRAAQERQRRRLDEARARAQKATLRTEETFTRLDELQRLASARATLPKPPRASVDKRRNILRAQIQKNADLDRPDHEVL